MELRPKRFKWYIGGAVALAGLFVLYALIIGPLLTTRAESKARRDDATTVSAAIAAATTCLFGAPKRPSDGLSRLEERIVRGEVDVRACMATLRKTLRPALSRLRDHDNTRKPAAAQGARMAGGRRIVFAVHRQRVPLFQHRLLGQVLGLGRRAATIQLRIRNAWWTLTPGWPELDFAHATTGTGIYTVYRVRRNRRGQPAPV